MIRIRVYMKATGEPVKRTPVTLVLDAAEPNPTGVTDRAGIAVFEVPPAGGKILVNGIARYQGHLEGEIDIPIWSLLEGEGSEERGSPSGLGSGSVAYPDMQTRSITVNGRELLTDSEGYLVDTADWSEAFVRAEAQIEGLTLTNEHWEVIRFLRAWFERKGVQAGVRDMIQHFRGVWGREKGSNRYLHALFPRGGPQKQGNRLAGLLRTKGEH
jgi:tRNA 2-thiouridine synthesizing protein E